MTDTERRGPQLDGSVNRGLLPPVYLSGGNLEPNEVKVANLLGSDQPACFPTVPAGFNANSHYYPGLGRSYLGASYVETPSHKQIQYSTEDIPSVQLTIRGAISPQVLQRWQLSQVSGATILP
jgi:hypothetical protein